MSDCGCKTEVTSVEAGSTLRLALALNATMFVVEFIGGIIGESSGLIADSLDMLADASAYGIAIAAVSRGALFKVRAATISGTILFLLGLGACVAAIGRALTGSEPESLVMAALATPALVVNTIVLRLLSKASSRRGTSPSYLDLHASRCRRQPGHLDRFAPRLRDRLALSRSCGRLWNRSLRDTRSARDPARYGPGESGRALSGGRLSLHLEHYSHFESPLRHIDHSRGR